MLQAEAGDDLVEVYYRAEDTSERLIVQTEPQLEAFIQFLGHQTTIESPDPGLGLSYGETVGLLYQICRQKYLKADFRAEQDRVLAAIMNQQQRGDIGGRPEFGESEPEAEDSSRREPPPSDLEQLAPPPAVEGRPETG